MLGAYADFELDNSEGEQEILLAAGSDKQAGRLYGACAGFVRRSPHLAERARPPARRSAALPTRRYRRCAIVVRQSGCAAQPR
jgi:hypothetical protein